MYVPEGTVRFCGCGADSLVAALAGVVFGASDGLALLHAATPIQIKSPDTADISVRLISVLLAI
jgi:hypothetical protein